MPVLEIKGLTKRFGKTEVLKGIDLDLEKGQVLAIIGSSGSGKTTLLRCMNLLEQADTGTIYVGGEAVFDGANPETQRPEVVRRNQLKLGLVFQQFHLFPQYSVLGNLTLAAKLLAKERPDFKTNKKAILEEIDAKAVDIISQVGLLQKLQDYPYQLSGGQQQRVAIARALMLSPEILCFDEPTSALDPELTGEVLGVMRELAERDTTMVIVTHEMNFAHDVADKIAFMADGIIIEEGSPQQVIDDPQNERTKAFLRGWQK